MFKMFNSGRSALVVAAIVACACVRAQADTVSLGTAGSFGVIAHTTVTNTGATDIFGNLALSTGTAITGAPTVHGATYSGTDATGAQALADASTAYTTLSGMGVTTAYTGTAIDLSLLGPFAPGVYSFSSSVILTGTLSLIGDGLHVFLIGSTLITSSNSTVTLNPNTDGTSPDICDVFWRVGSSTTLGTNSVFVGTIISNISTGLNTGAALNGRAFALTGAVTLDTNQIHAPDCSLDEGGGGTAVPLPSSAFMGLGLLGALGCAAWVKRRRASSAF